MGGRYGPGGGMVPGYGLGRVWSVMGVCVVRRGEVWFCRVNRHTPVNTHYLVATSLAGGKNLFG